MAGVLDSARFRTFIARGTESQRGKRYRIRAGRPRRHHGSAAALFDRGRNSHHRIDGRRDGRTPGAAHPRRRRRNREVSEDRQRLLRAFGRGRRRWWKPSSKTRRRSCPAPLIWKANTASTGCMSAFRASWARRGIEQIIEIKLTAEEQAALRKSADCGEGVGGGDWGLRTSS